MAERSLWGARWREVRAIPHQPEPIQSLPRPHGNPLEELAVEALRLAAFEQHDVKRDRGERDQSQRQRFAEAVVELSVAEAEHEEGKPASEDHPEDVVALEDEDDGLGIPPRVRLVVASAVAVVRHGWLARVLVRRSRVRCSADQLEVLELDAGIDAVARREEGGDDDPGEAAETGANEAVLQIFGPADHEHDGGHEQPAEEEQDSDGVEHPSHLAEVLLQVPGGAEDGYEDVCEAIHRLCESLV